MNVQNEKMRQVFVGIDWADKKHAFHLIACDGELLADAIASVKFSGHD